jgi:hypothetical protein
MTTVDHTEQNANTVTITEGDAVNWLIRSLIPELLDALELEQDAAWFRELPPYAGLTASGRPRGWAGAGKRLESAQNDLEDLHSKVLGMYNGPISTPASPAEESMRRVGAFARTALLPSRLGFRALRFVGVMLLVTDRAIQVTGSDPEERAALCRERDDEYREFLDLLLANGAAPSDRAIVTSPGAVTPDW